MGCTLRRVRGNFRGEEVQGLQTFTGQIPTALLGELGAAGLAVRSTTYQAGVAATEIRFLPQATEYIVPFLK